MRLAVNQKILTTMFSINIYLRFALIALFLGGGIALAILYGFWYSFPLILVGIILLVGYVLLGTIQSAGLMMQAGDLEGAEKRLNLTLSPKLLFVTNKAFYYILKGTMAAHKKNMDESEQWLLKAKEVNVPTDNEKAMIELQLANINASKNKWKQAEANMRALKKLKVTEPTIKAQIEEFNRAFAQRGQARAAARQGRRGGGNIRPGGKRRRPKMR